MANGSPDSRVPTSQPRELDITLELAAKYTLQCSFDIGLDSNVLMPDNVVCRSKWVNLKSFSCYPFGLQLCL